jgi:hypothetical protein
MRHRLFPSGVLAMISASVKSRTGRQVADMPRLSHTKSRIGVPGYLSTPVLYFPLYGRVVDVHSRRFDRQDNATFQN